METSLPIRDFNAVMAYGSREQKRIADFSHRFADQMKKLDASNIRNHMGALLEKLSQIDLKPFSKGRRFLFWHLPPKRPSLQKISHYQRLLIELDYMAYNLAQANSALFQEIQLLEKLHEESERYQQQISTCITKGKAHYEELSKMSFPSGSAAEQEVQADFIRYLDHLDQRLYELESSKNLSHQKSIQIRMLQDNHRKLAMKIQSSILNTIPLWQEQVSLALTVQRQEELTASLSKLLTSQVEIILSLQKALKS